MPSTENDTTITVGFTTGDRDGFAAIYQQYHLLIYYFVRKYIDDAQQAEDITADCFVKLWQHAEKGHAIKNAKAFLHTTARNASLDQLKRDQLFLTKKKEIEYLSEQDTESVFSLAEIKADVMAHVYKEIEKLPPQCREIFKLSYIEGMKVQEVASLLQIAEQSVSNQKTKALRLLRIALKDKEWMLVVFLAFAKN